MRKLLCKEDIIINDPTRHKPALIRRDKSPHHFRKAREYEFGDDLVGDIAQADGTKVRPSLGAVHLGDESDRRSSERVRQGGTTKKVQRSVKDILMNDLPAVLEESKRVSIRPRHTIPVNGENSSANLLHRGEGG